ncbi:MAG: pyruvate kinase [Bacteroidales bacterium]|nr:pyruvate kinase [Bacteroidales bacterium]
MQNTLRRTKIVATIGPASSSPEMIRALILAGMDVARLNFSHGNYSDHAQVIKSIHAISEELDKPITILQDLQGPKIRVGQIMGGEIELVKGETVSLIPELDYKGQSASFPLDYPHASEEAKPGTCILLADGLFQLEVLSVKGSALICKVIDGGILKSRKGVNFPDMNLKLPSLTEKDKKDLEFGLQNKVDWISLSFVRCAEDVRELKRFIHEKGYIKPVIAKIEKPQAVTNLEEILSEVQGIMVARGDLGVEMFPEKVPLIQKHIIEQCNRRGLPVITATQMLESMIHEPRPTRAEANDVANAIIDGTDCTMLSGESAVGDYPVKAVEMMDRIAREVESIIEFKSYPPIGQTEIVALSEAANRIEKVIDLKGIAVLTSSGHSAKYIASERPKAPIFALTSSLAVYHGLSLVWGIKPIYMKETAEHFDSIINITVNKLKNKQLITSGDKILIMGGIPSNLPGGTNFLKIHTVQ